MKLIVYDDSIDFGGHQIMAVRGVRALLARPNLEIFFFHHPENERLIAELPQAPNLTLIINKVPSNPLGNLRGKGLRALEKKFRELNANRMLCIQGNLEQSKRGLLAAHKVGLASISYLALPHTQAQMGARLGALRDTISNRSLHLPNRYITISERMKQRLLEHGATQPVSVVPNGIPLPGSAASARKCRSYTIGLLGRIEFKQKNQDWLIRQWIRQNAPDGDARLLIAGDGPDRRRLESMIKDRADIQLLSWQENTDSFFEQIDTLIIPSNYEGVPLVMLEALSRGIPVAASRCDGMQEILPSEWTFKPGDDQACLSIIQSLRQPDPDQLDTTRQGIQDEHNLERFNARFVAAVFD